MLVWENPTDVHSGRWVAAAEHWCAPGCSRCANANADARPPTTGICIVADSLAPPGPDCARGQRTLADRGRDGDSAATDAHLQPAANLDARAAARGHPDARAAAGDDLHPNDDADAPTVRYAGTTAEPISRTGLR